MKKMTLVAAAACAVLMTAQSCVTQRNPGAVPRPKVERHRPKPFTAVPAPVEYNVASIK